MAISTSASDKAGSSARKVRRIEVLPGPPVADPRAVEAMLTSCRLGEGGLDHALLGEVAAREVGDDAPVAEHIDVVAMLELVHFRRVPEECPSALGLGPNHIVDLDLG